MSDVTIANPVTVVEVDASTAKVITYSGLGYYAHYVCTNGLTPASTTVAYPVGYNTIIKQNGITIANNTEITFTYPGTYWLNWNLQFRNVDASGHNDAYVWVRKNGSDITNSKAIVAVPSRRGSTNGHTVGNWGWLITAAAGDYAQLMLAVESTDVDLHVYPAGVTPTSPVSACTSLHVRQVGF